MSWTVCAIWSQKIKHNLTSCTQREKVLEKEMTSPTALMLLLHGIACYSLVGDLRKWGKKKSVGKETSWEGPRTNPYKSSQKSEIPLVFPSLPFFTPLTLVSPALYNPTPLPSASSLLSWTVSASSKASDFQPSDLQTPKKSYRIPLHAHRSPVPNGLFLFFTVVLRYINKQVCSILNHEGHNCKSMQDLLFLALISYFPEWNHHGCGLSNLSCAALQPFTGTTVRSDSYIRSWVGTQHYPARNKLGFKCMLANLLPNQNKAHKKKMWGLPEGAGKTQRIMGNFWKEIWEVDFTHSLYW